MIGPSEGDSELRLGVVGWFAWGQAQGLKPSLVGPPYPSPAQPLSSSSFLLWIILWVNHLETICSSLNHPLLFPWNDLNSLPRAAAGRGLWGQLLTAGATCSECGQAPSIRTAEPGAQGDAQDTGLETDPPPQKGAAKNDRICQTRSGRPDCQGLGIER